MAFDRTPSPPGLEPETLDALRTALASSLAQGTHSTALHEALAKAAAEARAKAIPAEHFLLGLKEMWYAQPEVARTESLETQHALLQELISRCIQEYYSA